MIRPEVTLCSLTGRENASSFSDGTTPVFVFLCFPTVSICSVRTSQQLCCLCFIALLLETDLNVPAHVRLGLDLRPIFLCTDVDEFVKTGNLSLHSQVMVNLVKRSAVLHVQTPMNHMSR